MLHFTVNLTRLLLRRRRSALGSASCHKSALDPNSPRDAPDTPRPASAGFSLGGKPVSASLGHTNHHEHLFLIHPDSRGEQMEGKITR